MNYLGCFSSPNGMILSNDFAAAELTPESCVTVCGKGKMMYAGITLGSHCYCSNTSPDVRKKTSDAVCYYPCEGDKALKCGSHLYFSVYQAVGEFNFPFAVSVANASEAFTTVQIATAPAYDDAEVIFNFGDGTVIKTKNSTYHYMFTSPGTHEVVNQAFSLWRYSVTNSTRTTQRFSANHKTSSEQKNRSSFISHQSQMRVKSD